MQTLSSKPEPSALMNHVAAYAPMRILEIELGEPLPSLSVIDEKTGHSYQRAMCLVRLHTHPLGLVELQLVEGGMDPHFYVQHIWSALGPQINEHLQQDELLPVSGLDAGGLPGISTPACIKKLERFLAHAPFISVIVPTHDRPERIRICLQSLLALHYPRYEIIVVDNAPGSTATANLIQQTYRNISK